ncbi:MAG TPA: flagellar biosynthetic protein FliO [Oscillospiraceae bacterium]|nr:flagellar biosynthetic protein FliO [Oscillospiraceae bacterium]
MPLSISDTLYFLFSILAIVAILYGCYKLSKYMTKKVNTVSNTNNIKIIERVAFAQDKGLLIIEVCQKYYLIGFANNNIEILKELDKADLHFEESAMKQNFLETLNSMFKGSADSKTGSEQTSRPNFYEAFHSAFKSKTDSKAGDDGDKIDRTSNTNNDSGMGANSKFSEHSDQKEDK